MCRAEFRLLKDQYPPYADRVGFLAGGIDPTEGADVLQRYHTQQAYPWLAAVGNRAMLERYAVTSPSIKYAIDRRGLIVRHRGYGVGTAADWDEWLRTLASS